MRDNDGCKLDDKTLEAMRLRAVEAVLERDVPVPEVSASLGLTPQAVYRWLAKYRAGGREALKARPVPDAKPKLSPARARRLCRIGLSPQRPLFRAYQQDPEAVEPWKQEAYPLIRQRAHGQVGVIYSLDEAAARSDFHSGTTWAKRGKTPIVGETGALHSVNMISAVSAKGVLRFVLIEGTLRAPQLIEFCRRLLHDARQKVFLVVDGHPVHRSKAVNQYVRSTDGELELFHLPSYSPELNPDEWVWKNV